MAYQQKVSNNQTLALCRHQQGRLGSSREDRVFAYLCTKDAASSTNSWAVAASVNRYAD
jgi:hypothetical protein